MLRVPWSRGELATIRDAIEVTPNFEGRVAVRDILREALRPGAGPVELDLAAAERFAARLVAVDMATAIAKAKLLRAIRNANEVLDRSDAEQRADAA